MRNITERLKNAQKIDLNSVVGEFYGIIFATQYHAFALNQAMIYLSEEQADSNKEPKETKLFLDLANNRRDRSNADIQAFAKRLNEEGKDVLSKSVITYWNSLAQKLNRFNLSKCYIGRHSD